MEITKETIMDTYLFLREKNNTIPSETIDFMKDCALDRLKELGLSFEKGYKIKRIPNPEIELLRKEIEELKQVIADKKQDLRWIKSLTDSSIPRELIDKVFDAEEKGIITRKK